MKYIYENTSNIYKNTKENNGALSINVCRIYLSIYQNRPNIGIEDLHI